MPDATSGDGAGLSRMRLLPARPAAGSAAAGAAAAADAAAGACAGGRAAGLGSGPGGGAMPNLGSGVTLRPAPTATWPGAKRRACALI